MSLSISLASESDADSVSGNASKMLSSSFSSVIDSTQQERSFTKARSTSSAVPNNRMLATLDSGGSAIERAYYGYSGDELVMYGSEQGGIDMRFDTPISVLNDYVLNNGGAIQSSTSFFAEGYTFHINYKGTVTNIGDVTVPAVTFDQEIHQAVL